MLGMQTWGKKRRTKELVKGVEWKLQGAKERKMGKKKLKMAVVQKEDWTRWRK